MTIDGLAEGFAPVHGDPDALPTMSNNSEDEPQRVTRKTRKGENKMPKTIVTYKGTKRENGHDMLKSSYARSVLQISIVAKVSKPCALQFETGRISQASEGPP